jgi:hypothetical protein
VEGPNLLAGPAEQYHNLISTYLLSRFAIEAGQVGSFRTRVAQQQVFEQEKPIRQGPAFPHFKSN